MDCLIEIEINHLKLFKTAITYSVQPKARLSTRPRVKKLFSPVHLKTLKLGVNVYKKDSPVP